MLSSFSFVVCHSQMIAHATSNSVMIMIPEPENNEQWSRARRKKRFRPSSLKLKLKWGWKWKWDTRGTNEVTGSSTSIFKRDQRSTKKTPRAECPVCSVSELMNYPKPSPPKKKPSTQKFSQTHTWRRTVKKQKKQLWPWLQQSHHQATHTPSFCPIHSKSALLQPSRIRHKQHLNLQSKASYFCYEPTNQQTTRVESLTQSSNTQCKMIWFMI